MAIMADASKGIGQGEAAVYVRWKADVAGRTVGSLPVTLFALWAALIPFDNVLALGQAGTFTKWLAILMAIVILIDRMIIGRGRVFRPALPTLGWSLFMLLSIASTLWSASPSLTIAGATTLIGLFGVYTIVTAVPWSSNSMRLVQAAVLGGGVVAGLLAIHMFANGQRYLWTERASLLLGASRSTDPNHFGTSLILPLMLGLNGAAAARKARLLSFLPVAIVAAAIALTGSRGAILGAIVAAAVLLWENRGLGRRLFALIIVLFAILTVLALTVPADIALRYSLTSVLTSQGSGRLPLWKLALVAFRQKPLLGWGYNTFSFLSQGLVADYIPWTVTFGQVAHNIYLQVLSEMGAIGLVLLLVTLWAHYRAAARGATDKPSLTPVTAALIGILVTSATLGTLNYKYFWLVQMLAVAKVRIVDVSKS